MSFVGHCNCESIRVVLAEKPAGSAVCHCLNCKRAGGSAFSTNYILANSAVTIEDASGLLKTFKDANTKSGTVIERKFCSNCGSPVATISPGIPGMSIVKASLFGGSMAPPARVVFEDDQEEWVKIAAH